MHSRFESDLFSCVSDTGYIRFHRAAILHDRQREDPEITRSVADFNFFCEMLAAITDIRALLLATDCPQSVVDKEIVRMSRIACKYMMGVSGALGSAYIWLGGLFKRTS